MDFLTWSPHLTWLLFLAPLPGGGGSSRHIGPATDKLEQHSGTPHVLIALITHMGKGGGTGGDAHRLTPQNTVPLPKAEFDPLNREKMTFSKAAPSLFHQKCKKNCKFSYFFHFLKYFFLCHVLRSPEENFSFYPLPIPIP